MRFIFFYNYDILEEHNKKKECDKMPRKKRKKINQDEEPKAIKEMKKSRKKEENKPKRKKKLKFIILIIVIVLILVLGISLGVSAHTWKTLAKDMIYNENSVVIDTDGNTIAELRKRKEKNASCIERNSSDT